MSGAYRYVIGAAIDEDAGRLEHIVGDTMRRQQTVQPEPITSCLKTAHNTNRGVEPASNTGAQRREVVSRIFRTFGWLSGARPWLTR